jgi:hypothetical protein
MNLPCGSGKTLLARSILNEDPGAIYITSENTLVRQLSDFYPELNTLIGKRNYTCSVDPHMTCEDKWKIKSHKPCGNCAYYTARNRALTDRESTGYNAISYWYSMMDARWQRPTTIVVDEADKLLDLLMLISGNRFDKKFNPPKGLSFLGATTWLKDMESFLYRFIDKSNDSNKVTKALHDLDKVQNTLMGIKESPASFVHEYDKETGDLIVFPISPPAELVNRLLQCDRLVLMSATLYERDVKRLTPLPYVFKEFESPIDASRRRIVVNEGFAPNMNAETPPELVAHWIKGRVKEHPNVNTIVHVTYAMSKKLKPFIPGCMTNTPEDKREILDKFKATGGLWLASGCAEGLDLPGKLCELTLIPILPSPNIEDPIYKRRLALPLGQEEYDIRVLKTVQQQSGRATRNPNDYSLTVVGCRRFLALANKYKDQLPEAYQQQIWGAYGSRRKD